MKRKYFVAGIFLIGAVVLGTLIFYPQIPNSVPSSWDAQGNPNNWSPKWVLLVRMPMLMALMLVVFPLLAWLSRKRFPVQGFEGTYYYIMALVIAMLAYLQILTVRATVSHFPNMTRWILGGIFVVLVLLGNVLGKIRSNLIMGLRIPWTLGNEKAWRPWNRPGAYIVALAGLAGLVLTLVGARTWILVGIIVMLILVLNIYSLVNYWRTRHSTPQDAMPNSQ